MVSYGRVRKILKIQEVVLVVRIKGQRSEVKYAILEGHFVLICTFMCHFKLQKCMTYTKPILHYGTLLHELVSHKLWGQKVTGQRSQSYKRPILAISPIVLDW